MQQSRILIVLELVETANQVGNWLRAAGYKVVLCKNFDAAITVLETKKVSLIIADVHPENGGSVFDFLRHAKKNLSSQDTPFVLFSLRPTPLARYLEDGVRTTARLLGADLFLSMEKFEEVGFREKIGPLLPATPEIVINKNKEGIK